MAQIPSAIPTVPSVTPGNCEYHRHYVNVNSIYAGSLHRGKVLWQLCALHKLEHAQNTVRLMIEYWISRFNILFLRTSAHPEKHAQT